MSLLFVSFDKNKFSHDQVQAFRVDNLPFRVDKTTRKGKEKDMQSLLTQQSDK